MNRITRRTLLGGLTAVGAGTLLPQVSYAGVQRPTAPALQPLQDLPSVNVLTNIGGTAPGRLFLNVQAYMQPTAPHGLMILDDQGQPVFFRPIADNTFATDFRVQTYQGEEVLTWWEGTFAPDAIGIGIGSGIIANANYEVIATVGEGIDLHEFRLTDAGTALVISFQEVPADLTPVGGPADGMAWDGVVQELDLATGEPIFEWHSFEHVPISESDVPYPGAGTYDYMHVNSVDLDTDGSLLISGRFSSTIYKVDRVTGEVLFRLGGSASSFLLGPGADFTSQHHAQGEGGNVYRLFDNGTHGTMLGELIGIRQSDRSRVAWIKVDESAGTASLVNEIIHPEGLQAFAEGGAERMPNGNVVIGWGQASRVSEFSPTGELLFDAAFDPGFSTYRAYRFEWQGQPACAPEVAVDRSGRLHAVWNGATEVAAWRVLGGTGRAGLTAVAQLPWKGLDTTLPLAGSVHRDIDHVRVQALDKRGRVLGTSPLTALEEVGRTAR